MYSVEHALDRMDLIHLSLEKVEIKVKEKNVLRKPVSTRSLDFGVINPAYIGKKNRYIVCSLTFKNEQVGQPITFGSIVSEASKFL